MTDQVRSTKRPGRRDKENLYFIRWEVYALGRTPGEAVDMAFDGIVKEDPFFSVFRVYNMETGEVTNVEVRVPKRPLWPG